jgi:hypothetical protein
MSPTSPEKSAGVPFADDLTYLMAEFQWIKARSSRIGYQREDGIASGLTRSRRRAGLTEPVADCECRLTVLRSTEDRLRADIDTRLNLNRKVGPEMGLDRLCREHGLDPFERLVLLIGSLPVVGNVRAGHFLEGASVIGISGTIDLECCWDLAELDSDARIRSLVCLLPQSSLIRCGLVSFGFRPATPGDLARSGVEVTGRALATITGIPEFASLASHFEAGEEE